MDAGQHAKSKDGFLKGFLSVIGMVAFVLVCTWGLREFVFQPYSIPSGSMEDTLVPGDYVFSEKITYYMRDVEVGDIVTFEDPEVAGRTLVKRVVAVGGQTVTFADGHVYVDGVMADETHVKGSSVELSRHAINVQVTYPYTVPEGYVWVMGDNRENSQDSRYFGAVPISSITGRAVLIYWPLQDFGLLTQ